MTETFCGECKFFDTAACNLKDKVDAKTPKCSDFYRKRALEIKPKEEKEKKPLHKINGRALEGPYEAIYQDDKPCFLVHDNNGFKLYDMVTNDSKEVAPKEANEYPYEPYGYEPGEIPNLNDLYFQVRDMFVIFLDLEKEHIDFLAACVLMTYQQDKLATVPYVFLVGDNESGKTVALNLLAKLCYRAMLGVSVNVADIYGFLGDEDTTGTILEDEVQGIDKDTEKIKIYKSGYKAGATVPRWEITPFERRIRYNKTFCFKACASEMMPHVKGFLERFIVIPMIEGIPTKDWVNATKDDYDRIRKLRNQLLKWRLATRDSILPEITLDVRGRLAELWKPIIQIVHGLTIEEKLNSYLLQIQDDRERELTNTFEGHLVKAVSTVYVANEPLLVDDVWNVFQKELNGKFNDEKPNQMDTSEFGIVYKNRVGYRMREVFNAKRGMKRVKEGDVETVKRYYELNDSKVLRVFKKYHVVTKLPSFPTSTGVEGSSPMEKPMEKEALIPLEDPKLGNSVTTCFLCLKDIPVDHKDCTMLDGKWVHIPCFRQLEDGRNQPFEKFGQ